MLPGCPLPLRNLSSSLAFQPGWRGGHCVRLCVISKLCYGDQQGTVYLSLEGESSCVIDDTLAYPADCLLCCWGLVAEDGQGWRMHSSLTYSIDALERERARGGGGKEEEGKEGKREGREGERGARVRTGVLTVT